MSTPRIAWRIEKGSARSPSAICTLTRCGAEAPRLAHQGAHLDARRRAAIGSSSPPDHPRCARQQDHAAHSSPRALRQPPRRRPRLECLARAAPSGRRDRNRPAERNSVAYVIAEPCIGEKDNSCVEVCPVDCIHPTPDEPDYDERQAALHRPRRVHRLRRLRRGLPGGRLLRRGPAPRRVGQVHRDQRGVLQGRLSRPALAAYYQALLVRMPVARTPIAKTRIASWKAGMTASCNPLARPW